MPRTKPKETRTTLRRRRQRELIRKQREAQTAKTEPAKTDS